MTTCFRGLIFSCPRDTKPFRRRRQWISEKLPIRVRFGSDNRAYKKFLDIFNMYRGEIRLSLMYNKMVCLQLIRFFLLLSLRKE
ncbi:hypothetical protein HID58_047679 [Brassica napus]|uniref:BnaC02g24690D protein n=2 Tax=Brassica napus TaxID=3708 RepID=A0A078FP21_BRANA|nr:hypothetical protein HID58_047679 [Brassica napus]CAF1913763.1 unnamed protein product [Brassica napus]CDY14644.1 BnaC02g24690D [Brassica napus]